MPVDLVIQTALYLVGSGSGENAASPADAVSVASREVGAFRKGVNQIC